MEITADIEKDEVMVRCIGHELYYSSTKKRISSTAFMPPSGSNEVSLLRLKFTNASRCKEHAKSIKKNDYIYCGLGIAIVENLLKANTIDENYQIKLISTPLNERLEKVDISTVNLNSPGLPFHADLVCNWTPIKGQRAPNAFKKIAKFLSKNPPTKFCLDPNPLTNEWSGDALEF